MKNYLYALAAAALLSSCVNGKGEKGTPVDPDSLVVRDTVATLSPAGNDFVVAETMQSAVFLDFFTAEVDDKGVVTCQFKNFDDPNFAGIFNADDCPHDKITITNAMGRCRGVAVLNNGGDVSPVLLMLMEDDHAERLSLYDLSCGKTSPTHRSSQSGITLFAPSQPDEFEDGDYAVGIAVDGTRIIIDWDPLQ